MTERPLQDTIDAACTRLEKAAVDMGAELSFSLSSVGVLEEILIALKEMGADQGALNGACFLVGAYLGEILKRETGGEWVAGEEVAVRASDSIFFPVARARKFIADPKGNSLVLFAEVFVSQQGVLRG